MNNRSDPYSVLNIHVTWEYIASQATTLNKHKTRMPEIPSSKSVDRRGFSEGPGSNSRRHFYWISIRQEKHHFIRKTSFLRNETFSSTKPNSLWRSYKAPQRPNLRKLNAIISLAMLRNSEVVEAGKPHSEWEHILHFLRIWLMQKIEDKLASS